MAAITLNSVTYLLVALALGAATLSVFVVVRTRTRERKERQLAHWLVAQAETRLSRDEPGVPEEKAIDALSYIAQIPLHALADDQKMLARVTQTTGLPNVQDVITVKSRDSLVELLNKVLDDEKTQGEIAEWMKDHSARARVLSVLRRIGKRVVRTLKVLVAIASFVPRKIAGRFGRRESTLHA